MLAWPVTYECYKCDRDGGGSGGGAVLPPPEEEDRKGEISLGQQVLGSRAPDD